MRRAVLDSHAVDPLIGLPGAYETLRTAADDGRLRLLFTHINIESRLLFDPRAECQKIGTEFSGGCERRRS